MLDEKNELIFRYLKFYFRKLRRKFEEEKKNEKIKF